MKPNSDEQSALPTPLPNWHARKREVREGEWEARNACAKMALHGLKHLRGRKFTVAEVTKLFEMASTFGRRATGMATDHVEHEWSQRRDPEAIAAIDQEIERLWKKCIEVKAEPVISDQSSVIGNA